jgi:hypothetical protein
MYRAQAWAPTPVFAETASGTLFLIYGSQIPQSDSDGIARKIARMAYTVELDGKERGDPSGIPRVITAIATKVAM